MIVYLQFSGYGIPMSQITPEPRGSTEAQYMAASAVHYCISIIFQVMPI